MHANTPRSPLLPEPAARQGGPYALTGVQSAAWHDRGVEGEVVRREIRAAARGASIFDVDGTLLGRSI